MRKLLQLLFLIIIVSPCISQDSVKIKTPTFTRKDTLRGSITPERAWWNVLKYSITVEPDINSKSISGENVITFKAIDKGTRMQLDLQQPMEISNVEYGKNKAVSITRNEDVYYVEFDSPITKGTVAQIKVRFHGHPREAVNPPWDGGWIWSKDEKGNPWISAACQVLGASVWYPCKDYQGDEPDSASLSIIVPDSLVGVGNGKLDGKTPVDGGKMKYTWTVKSAINNYNIIPYIGKYVNWSEKFNGAKGTLSLNYWAVEGDVEKAKQQFNQVPGMLKCFEYWFGPYPFYEDGYQLVQSPHLGMEHQSAIAYGNKFKNGYLGNDLSGTGWGNKWDFIIIHESGHEWFGNNITTNEVADMWVHEGFTSYSEALYTECQYGKKAGSEYCIGLRKNIKNDKPVTGLYGVNREGSDDMYYKGSNLLHTIRQIIDDDEKFRQMLRGLNKAFYHKTVSGAEIKKYICTFSGKDLSKVFEQYLETVMIPIFEYKISNGELRYRWSNCVKGFDMPVRILTDKPTWLYPGEEWKTSTIKNDTLTVDSNFYVDSRKM